MGIEPTLSAWKAEVLPLNYTRPSSFVYRQPPVRPKVSNPPFSHPVPAGHEVEGGGFEPPKAEPTDLQSAPFDRSGTPPGIHKRLIFSKLRRFVNRLRPFLSPFYTNITAKTSPCHCLPMLNLMGAGYYTTERAPYSLLSIESAESLEWTVSDG